MPPPAPHPPLTPVEIFTDGACRGNPGPGGWGALLRHRHHEKEMGGFASHTTNNRMELLAAIRALESLKRPCQVTVVTDSIYLRNGITRWITGWKARNWRKADGGKLENVVLWQRLDAVAAKHAVTWTWVRGHAGHPENERADALARKAIDEGLAGICAPDPEG